jgi:hypothetical protein
MVDKTYHLNKNLLAQFAAGVLFQVRDKLASAWGLKRDDSLILNQNPFIDSATGGLTINTMPQSISFLIDINQELQIMYISTEV